MTKYNLIVNTGSSSKKYAVYAGERELANLHLEAVDKNKKPAFLFTFRWDDRKLVGEVSQNDYSHALEYLFKLLKEWWLLKSKDEIERVGIRVVAPGLIFQQNSIIDTKYIKALKEAEQRAPLHLGTILFELTNLRKFFGKKPIVGISDSAFHHTTIDKARYYAIPLADTKKYEIYRYGYHGISLESIVHKLKQEKALPKRLIVCHMGSGVSLTAIKDGKSIDTTMGFTPLEGMVMATRVGDIDPGAVIYLSKKKQLNHEQLMAYFNKQSGLFGLSGGLSDDTRALLKYEVEGNDQAKLALEHRIYKIQKQIGAFAVALGGLDMIVFSATIGERGFEHRERICNELECLGVKLDKKVNGATIGAENVISAKDSRVVVRVVKTDESGSMARALVKVK